MRRLILTAVLMGLVLNCGPSQAKASWFSKFFEEVTGISEIERTKASRKEAEDAENIVAALNQELDVSKKELDRLEVDLQTLSVNFEVNSKASIEQFALIASHLCDILEQNLQVSRKNVQALKSLRQFSDNSTKFKELFSQFSKKKNRSEILSQRDQATLKVLVELFDKYSLSPGRSEDVIQTIGQARKLTQISSKSINRILLESLDDASKAFESLENNDYISNGSVLLTQLESTTTINQTVNQSLYELLQALKAIIATRADQSAIIQRIDQFIQRRDQIELENKTNLGALFPVQFRFDIKNQWSIS